MADDNATLKCHHFRWNAGTRIHARACWNNREYVTVTLPPNKGLAAQSWVLPASYVELDEGVELEIETDKPWEALK